MPSNSPNFSALAAKYLSSNLHRLECATGCFVCLLCDADTWRGTWNPDSFIEHVDAIHPGVESLACVFCGLDWPRDQFVAHVIDHLTMNPVHAALYACPIQSTQNPHSSRCAFQTNNLQALRFHVASSHAGKNTLWCSHCSKTETAFTAWVSHIQTHVYQLSHCTAEGCNAKSPSRLLLVSHAKRKHGPDCGELVRDGVEVSPLYELILSFRGGAGQLDDIVLWGFALFSFLA